MEHFLLQGEHVPSTLRFLPNDELVALTRPHWIGTSRPPYREWTWTKINENIGGPNYIRLQDGSLWAAGRQYGDKATTVLARMTRDRYEPVVLLKRLAMASPT